MNELMTNLGETLLAGNVEEIKRLTEEALRSGSSPQDILEEGLRPAMESLGDRFSRGEAYLPELLVAADTMKASMEILEPAIVSGGVTPKATMLLGTVEGDIHDIGKNLVKMMFEGAGFRVIDLDINVKAEKFLEAYHKEKPDLVGLSALLTTTIGEMEKVIQAIREFDPNAKFIVGGAPITQEFADRVGADGYAPDAGEAVKEGNRIIGLS
jgi:5-methyltetrahydrofolate--homocysteine methyltransferase